MKLVPAVVRHAERALSQALQFVYPSDAVLRHYFRDHPELGQRDRALIADSVYTVLRRKRSLSASVANESTRMILYAAWVRMFGMSVRTLAEYASESELKVLAAAKAYDPAAAEPAVRDDMPDWLYERLAKAYAPDKLMALCQSLNQPAALDLRVNTLLAKREDVLAGLNADGIEAVATRHSPTGIRLAEKPAINRHRYFKEGWIEVQDEGSQILCQLVAPKRGELVADFCAGAGGKTLALAAMMRSTGRVYAFDVHDKRLDGLRPRLKRAGASNVHPRLISSENDTKIKRLAGKLDRVLVDAPCSGIGTLRRNPDFKWRQGPKDVAELVAKQRAILMSAASMLKPGGRLVYATCSLLPEENQEQVDALLAGHPELQLIDAPAELARHGIELGIAGPYLILTPQQHGCDGFFAAAMERRKAG